MTREEREQALEWFKNRPITMSGAKKMYDLAIAALEQPEPCEDAVSRADVEHEIANILRGIFVEYQDIAKKTASKLPSVTPKQKTGKWIDKSNGIEGAWNYCSVCGEQAIDLYDFCPNCGARMTEEDV